MLTNEVEKSLIQLEMEKRELFFCSTMGICLFVYTKIEYSLS